MANVVVDTTLPAYTVRRGQFADIVSFWRPNLVEYQKLGPEAQQAWRDSDPFLNDILRFIEKFNSFEADQL